MDLQKQEYKDWKTESLNFLDSLKGKNPFVVPQDFFEFQKKQIHLKNQLSNSDIQMSVPEEYFEQMQQQVKSQLFLKNRSLIPDFEVPAQCFERSAAQIESKIRQNTHLSNQFKPYHWYAVAAMLIIMFSVSILWLKFERPISNNNQIALNMMNEDTVGNSENNTSKKTIVSIESEELENYLINNYSADDLVRN